MRALIDQQVAGIRDLIDEYPNYAVYLRAGYGAREMARFVADDCLSILSERADETAERQLMFIAARLYAYLEVTR